jgi:N-acetyl sugar amidotransferase
MSDNRLCSRCVLDTTDPDIVFNEKGVCNYCDEFDEIFGKIEHNQQDLDNLIAEIKTEGAGKEHNCLLGLSGGVDSSYLAYLAYENGLNPLIVHFDNGWNSELAVSNIQKIVDKLGFGLETYVIDWKEFRDLQRAFIKASVVDIEMLTDHAIFAAMYKIARQNKIKYILSGTNYATESGMPPSWTWSKRDLRNIKAIHKRFGEEKLKTFPTLGKWKWLFLKYSGIGVTFVELLNYLDYKKSEAISILEKEFGWRYYGGKHYESIFTKFYQAYILPEKYGIDKRKAHLSSLIRNKEITRKEALEQLSLPLYTEQELVDDKRYVLKKLGFSEKEFDNIMKLPPCPHNFYPSSETLMNYLRTLRGKLVNLS